MMISGITVEEMAQLCGEGGDHLLSSGHMTWLMDRLNEVQDTALCICLDGSSPDALPHLKRTNGDVSQVGMMGFAMNFLAGIAQLVVRWAHCPAWWNMVGLSLWPSSEPVLWAIFPLELAWVQTPLPITFGWEYKPRSSLCTHAFHRTDSKDPIWVNAINKNTPSMHHLWRRNVTTSMVGLKKGHICKNLTQNGEPQRSSWERRRRRSHKFVLVLLIGVLVHVWICVMLCQLASSWLTFPPQDCLVGLVVDL